MSRRTDVLVIGGGVIGLSCARELLSRGRSVRVVERRRPGSGASHGNCGLVTPSHAVGLNRPGMVGKVLRWLLREDSPVLVRPRLDPGFLRWSLSFARSCSRRRMLEVLAARAALLQSSRQMFDRFVETDALRCEWEPSGLLEVFATPGARDAAAPIHELLARHGIRSESLSPSELRTREPALREGLAGGTWYAGDAKLRPDRLVAELARAVRQNGGRIEEDAAVHQVELTRGGITLRAGDARFESAWLVLATGAWSPVLAAQLGVRLPVQPGKGYSITLPAAPAGPRIPLLLADANMAVTPWESGYRLGGTMELAGYDERSNPVRLAALRAGARRFLRDPHEARAQEEWNGFRPMTPDELPILGPAPGCRNVLLATGHGMMGVSMAPATAQLIAGMVAGESPFLDPAPYAVTRFAS